MADRREPKATEYTAQNRQKKTNPNSTMPITSFGEGGPPPMAELCMEKISTVNGTENTDGIAMIPTKSQK
jgi:hypothetical protein